MRLSSFIAIAIALALSTSASAQNTGQRLTDATATFDYTPGGSGNLSSGPPVGSGNVSMNFQLDSFSGDPLERQLVRGNWFYRVAGDTRERYLGDASNKTVLGSDYVKWEFPDIYGPGATKIPDISAEMDFSLISHNPDSATVTTALCFQNNSSTPIQVESFFAVDFNLDATSAGDVFQPLSFPGGRLIRADDGLTAGAMFSSITTGSSMDNDGVLFGQLNDSVPDSFPDVNAGVPLGGDFGDGAALLQFDHIIPAFSGGLCDPALITISVARNGETPVLPELIVPEPAGCVLVCSMMLLLGRRRPSK